MTVDCLVFVLCVSLMRSSTSKNFRFLAQDRAWEYIREAKLSVLKYILAHQVKTGAVEICLMTFVFQDNEEICLEKLSLSRQAIGEEIPKVAVQSNIVAQQVNQHSSNLFKVLSYTFIYYPVLSYTVI